MRACWVLGFLAWVGCGGTSDGGLFAAEDAGGSSMEDAGAGASSSSEAGSDAGAGGAQVIIHLRASAAPFAHQDGLAGETPTEQVVGIRSLELSRTENDPSPALVFDLGPNGIEAPLAGGSDTIVARVPARSLVAGSFTWARVGITMVRYAVAARVHAASYPTTDGILRTTQVMSEGGLLGGTPGHLGDYESAFLVGGAAVAMTAGNDPVPAVDAGGGLHLETIGTRSYYVFPVSLAVDPNVRHDVTVDFDVNVDHDFRWQDESQPGYTSGVFDVSPPTSYEPVRSFGANSFTVSVEGS